MKITTNIDSKWLNETKVKNLLALIPPHLDFFLILALFTLILSPAISTSASAQSDFMAQSGLLGQTGFLGQSDTKIIEPLPSAKPIPPIPKKIMRPVSITGQGEKKPVLPLPPKVDTSVNSVYNSMVEQANAKTFTVVSGSVNGTYVVLANDMSFVLDEPDKMRVLPVLGRGSYNNIYDVLLLKGIDAAIASSDVIEIVKRENKIPNIDQRLAYITALTNEEMHILVSESIKSVEDLQGKRVNFDVKGSGTSISAPFILDRLGIKVQPFFVDASTAHGMVARGELEASMFISPKPVRAIESITASSKLRLLEIPYDNRLEDVYYPATFDFADYPALVAAGKPVNSIAAKTLLITYNWGLNTERYQRTQRFVEAFFSKFYEFRRASRHPKWKEVNLAATFSGLPRFKAASDWLIVDAQVNKSDETIKTQLRQFLEDRAPKYFNKSAPNPLSEEEQDKIFEDFSKWRQKRRS